MTHNQFTGYNATDLTYPNGRQVASGYDPLYRRNAITEVTGGTSIAQWYFYGGRVATVVLGNGQTVSMMNNAQTHSAVQPKVANPPWNSSSPTTMDHRLGYNGSGRMINKRYVQGAGSTSAAPVGGIRPPTTRADMLIFETGGGTGGAWFSDNDVTTVQPACETIFTGRLYDPETQLYWYRARYYIPGLGRFVGRDPIKLVRPVQLYSYYDSNPLNRMDASGMKTKKDAPPPLPKIPKCLCIPDLFPAEPDEDCGPGTFIKWALTPTFGVCRPKHICHETCEGLVIWFCASDGDPADRDSWGWNFIREIPDDEGCVKKQ